MTPAHQYQLFGAENLNVKVAPAAFFNRYITTQMQISFVFLPILFDKRKTTILLNITWLFELVCF